MTAICGVGSFAMVLVKQGFPVAGLVKKLLTRKVGMYVKAIVGGNPIRPRSLVDRAVSFLIPVLMVEVCLPEASQNNFKGVARLMKSMISATGVSAKAINCMAKHRIKLNSTSRYVLFCCLYVAMNKRKQLAELIQSEERE